ncbi:hypothetical protein [Polycladidibacter stylochi]|uniref:hypothetical protein n=1 Tax=Polycladidibacter stylochi TaxID=1807766 RepID=UPI00082C1EB8|nr:hypothetical protein [Pseudovibrio stylochi]
MIGQIMPKPGQCKWTEGDSGSYHFPCQNKASEGGSYCDYHRSIVYETPEQRKKRAEQNKFVPNRKQIAA